MASTPKPETTTQEQQKPEKRRLGLRQRVKHFTFAWFLCTMSTGGLAVAIGETPHQFKGQYHISLVLYLTNFFLFLLFTLLTLFRYTQHKHHFLSAFSSPPESLFAPAFILSICVLIAGVQSLAITHGPGTPSLISLVYILYWIYAAISLVGATLQYWLILRKNRAVPFSPAVFLAGYSCMLTGTLASLIVASQPARRHVAIVVSGVAYQGFGWCISLVALVLYISSLLEHGIPPLRARPAMFIPVGSCAYTVVALVGMARGIGQQAYTEGYFARHTLAPEILHIMAFFSSVFVYVFAVWLFGVALVANLSAVGKMPFSLAWWAFIFPNVGFALATSALGRELESEPILWIASVMTALLVVVWIVAAAACVRAVWKGDIVWPGKDEDKDR
ncbi:hypothetical protein COCC4DRAFT_128747 [Bipolaris maydis ATCC 48331]|uniref:C4-dicarboxylate transporter/malic acid transport protein n=2 Tax=Cochliobolus heterostrophus TaxID=5016 RepID=M2TXP1_COCH5|nr:uncharacterized protein COCC4DRAFT_128747 [Bipolaris maydis ATCC 48331]EMD91284.1 hypothetical protein COCHEDRAFT_1102057 [Bipolaris maydis C5]KAJ5027504.1 voltage-dependent anion channel [Bipolaris maydis]ENI08958.1 hypothetical protein COCC4DRAFT_128747 [Bipolaris maydis ATCC 48331]KAJ5058707.1 voltage-dependent anion channel [Bipolaris maydis]KAJ6202308.1 voltage-dependent anion channel [Bipolaris maydis]